MTRRCVLAAQKTVCAWAAAWAQGEGGDSAPLLRSGETPPRDSCIQLGRPQHRTDLELLERGQRRPQQ